MNRSVQRIVFGLGNPGPEYEGTRHNVGFEVLDRLALREGLLFEPPHSVAGYSGPRSFLCARSDDPNALLVKPLTFMNRSGEIVSPLVQWAGIGPGDIFVVYDDIDLPLSALRMRPFGGSGGHRGVSSIINSLSTDRFPRLRMGIGRSTTDAARHVLSKFTVEEREEIEVSLNEAVEALLCWLRTGDLEACMTRFHSRWNPPDPGTKRTNE